MAPTVWSKRAPLAHCTDLDSHTWSVADANEQVDRECTEMEEDHAAMDELERCFLKKKKKRAQKQHAPIESTSAPPVEVTKTSGPRPENSEPHPQNDTMMEEWEQYADDANDTEEVRQRKDEALASLLHQTPVQQPTEIPMQVTKPEVESRPARSSVKSQPTQLPVQPAAAAPRQKTKSTSAKLSSVQSSPAKRPVQPAAQSKQVQPAAPAQTMFKGRVKEMRNGFRKSVQWCFIEAFEGKAGKQLEQLESLARELGKKECWGLDIFCPRDVWPVAHLPASRGQIKFSVMVNAKGQLQASEVQLIDDGRYEHWTRTSQSDWCVS